MPSDEFGYIVVSRKLYQTCPFWNERREFSRHEAWEDMIQMAAWKEHQRSVNGTVVTLERGEFLASIRFLSKRWLWSRSRVSRFLKVVADMGRIAKRNRTTEGDTYLLVNYDSYQSPRDSNRDSGGTAAGQQRDSGVTKRIQVKTGKASKTPVPPALDTPRFREAWEDFRQHRREKRSKLTPLAESRALAKLARFDLSTAIRAVEESIENGWLGVFPEKVSQARGGRQKINANVRLTDELHQAHLDGSCVGYPNCSSCYVEQEGLEDA